MPNATVPQRAGLVQLFSLRNTDAGGSTNYGFHSVTVSIDNVSNAYVADAGPNGGGFPQFYVVPRQNAGGPVLSSPATVTVTCTAVDSVSGAPLTPITMTCNLVPPPPPPPSGTTLALQSQLQPVLTNLPADPGTGTIVLS